MKSFSIEITKSSYDDLSNILRKNYKAKIIAILHQNMDLIERLKSRL